MRALVLRDQESLDEQIKPIKYQNGKYVTKIKLYLHLIKTSNQIILGKGLFTSIKEHLCLTKGHLVNPEGPMKVESPQNRDMFLTRLIQIKKKYFFQEGYFEQSVRSPDVLSF